MVSGTSFAVLPTSLLLFRLRVRLRPYALHFSSYLTRNAPLLQCGRSFSSFPPQPDPRPPLPPTPPPPCELKAGLSARMSFVFEQIDAMERNRGAKDEALQNIRFWRQNKQLQREQHDGAGSVEDAPVFSSEEAGSGDFSRLSIPELNGTTTELRGSKLFKEVELVHPWPEWIELMELLVKQNYFDHRRIEEAQVTKDLPIDLSGIAEDVGFDFTRDWATVRSACLNFGRDRFDILRSLSKKDLQILVGSGCPSTDKKVVFSAKLLRKHAHLDEGDVCCACELRSTCSSGYLPACKEDEAQTLDLMRVLLLLAFDSINGSVENKALLKMKSLKTVARKLVNDVVKLATVPIDPNLPLPVIKRPPPKVKQPPPSPKKRVGRDDVEMKKGDWLCPKCDFMNFAKNVVCLQCDAKRPKRQLLPGEWECPECNFLNYRRNMACFHCDHKRPQDGYTGSKMQFKPEGLQRRFERTTGPKGYTGWNFDFDENESDGVDVAAFEFADPPKVNDSPLHSPSLGGTSGSFVGNVSESNSIPIFCDSRNFSNPDENPSSHAPGTGFDDFDDINSYEITGQPAKPKRVVSNENISKTQISDDGSGEFDNFEDDYICRASYEETSSSTGFSNDLTDDSVSEFLCPQWKATGDRTSIFGWNNQCKETSNDILWPDTDLDDIDSELAPGHNRHIQHYSCTRGPEKTRTSVSEDDPFDSESDDFDYLHSVGKERKVNGGTRKRSGTYLKESSYDSPNAINRSSGVGRGKGNSRISFRSANDGSTSRGQTRKTRGARNEGNRAQRVSVFRTSVSPQKRV